MRILQWIYFNEVQAGKSVFPQLVQGGEQLVREQAVEVHRPSGIERRVHAITADGHVEATSPLCRKPYCLFDHGIHSPVPYLPDGEHPGAYLLRVFYLGERVPGSPDPDMDDAFLPDVFHLCNPVDGAAPGKLVLAEAFRVLQVRVEVDDADVSVNLLGQGLDDFGREGMVPPQENRNAVVPVDLVTCLEYPCHGLFRVVRVYGQVPDIAHPQMIEGIDVVFRQKTSISCSGVPNCPRGELAPGERSPRHGPLPGNPSKNNDIGGREGGDGE